MPIELALLFVFLLIIFVAIYLCRIWLQREINKEIASLPQYLQAERYANLGESAKAVALVEQIQVGESNTPDQWTALNSKVNVLVNCGFYAQALAIVAPLKSQLHEALREGDESAALVLINHAEALHNLAQDAEALAQLKAVKSQLCESFALAGLQMLMAWIQLHRGDLDVAQGNLDAAANFPRLTELYEAEIQMTRAALQRERGEYDAALESVERALSQIRRVSSHRNALVMRASIYSAQGKHDAAERDFQDAFEAKYKAQAAYGLLRYGALLAQKQAPSTNFSLTLDALPEPLLTQWQQWDPESRLSMRVRAPINSPAPS